MEIFFVFKEERKMRKKGMNPPWLNRCRRRRYEEEEEKVEEGRKLNFLYLFPFAIGPYFSLFIEAEILTTYNNIWSLQNYTYHTYFLWSRWTAGHLCLQMSRVVLKTKAFLLTTKGVISHKIPLITDISKRRVITRHEYRFLLYVKLEQLSNIPT